MRGGTIFFGVLILIAIAAIAALSLRPATVIGVSEKSLAYSVRQAADVDETGRCQELRDDEEFACTVFGRKPAPEVRYRVEVDDYGCWNARTDPKVFDAQSLDGCVTIIDLIRLDD